MKKNSIGPVGRFTGGVLFLLITITATAQPGAVKQKPSVDTAVFDKWPSIERPDVSNDGNYVFYPIRNQPRGSRTLVIRATKSDWKVEMEAAGGAAITQDSRKVIFIKPKDQLCIVNLGTSSTEYVPDAKSFGLIKQGTGDLLVYQLNGPAGGLEVRDLSTGRHSSFDGVAGYSFSNDGKTLLLQTESKNKNATSQTLKWVNLADGQTRDIWHGTRAGGFVFDASGTQLAFAVEDKANNQTAMAFWYYKAGTGQAVLLTDDRKGGVQSDVKLDSIRWQGFSRDGSRLFINLKKKDSPAPKVDSVKVDVWSYTDPKLQSQQLHELDPKNPDGGPRAYAAVIGIHDRRVIRLEGENDQLRFNFDSPKQDFGLIINAKGDVGNEWNWNEAALATVYLVSTVDGSRKLLAEKVAWRTANTFVLSPEGKYVIWYDPDEKNYFAYAVSSGVVRNITKEISGSWRSYDQIDEPKPSYGMIRGSAGWIKDDAALLIYGQHDIFQVDPSGQLPPINLTHGYGKKHNVQFKVTRFSAFSGDAISNNERLILTAFNRTTKDSGFFAVTLGKTQDPELLTMQPYLFGPYEHDNPKKARDAEVHLVRRMRAAESPNYFWTTDFKTFTPLTDLHPENEYNWLTSELVTWKTFDGSLSQGVLYKPENFDPTKKYPVIFHYYERLSDEMHEFTYPEASRGPMNIPYFVSNGYLVFTPDIHYTIGYPGRSAFNSVVSAANHLSKMSWVDATKMGLQGHSFGGFETLYIITHTNMFAAAMASSPMSNFISAYGSVIGDGSSRQRQYELYRDRIGATLWERPDLYIENSPVLRADKVTTPLLMMSNKEDGDVPFPQGVEMFTAMRRLGKKSWMLQYDGEDHMVSRKAAEDLTVRMTQFFDHYLKGAPPPKWMTEGVPARLKGVESGMESGTSETLP